MKAQLNSVEQQAFLKTLINGHIKRIMGVSDPSASSLNACYTRLSFMGTIQLGKDKLPACIGLEGLKKDYVPIPATLTEKKLAVLIEIYNVVSKKSQEKTPSIDMFNMFSQVKQALLQKYAA